MTALPRRLIIDELRLMVDEMPEGEGREDLLAMIAGHEAAIARGDIYHSVNTGNFMINLTALGAIECIARSLAREKMERSG